MNVTTVNALKDKIDEICCMNFNFKNDKILLIFAMLLYNVEQLTSMP